MEDDCDDNAVKAEEGMDENSMTTTRRGVSNFLFLSLQKSMLI